MGAKIETFAENPSGHAHPAYESSMLLPVAPEHSTGEVLLASAYRGLICGETDATINLEHIDGLQDRLAAAVRSIDSRADVEAFRQLWRSLLVDRGGLTSPVLRGEKRSRLRQLMPLVPELSRVSGVLGKVRSRWQPSNLLVSTIHSGSEKDLGNQLVLRLRDALTVGPTDDYLAQVIQSCLLGVRDIAPGRERGDAPTDEQLNVMAGRYPPAWRQSPKEGYLPSERFARDLEYIIHMKSRLTRRQWSVLIESLLRLGMGMHQMWLCRLNTHVWRLCSQVSDTGECPSLERVVEVCWSPQDIDEPLLKLSEDAKPQVDRLLHEFGLARIGMNLLLWALEDAGCGWPERSKLGGMVADEMESPAAAVHSFLKHVWEHRDKLHDVLAAHRWRSLTEAAASVADGDQRFLSGQATRNLQFFIRYSLLQTQTKDETQRQYDQGYLLHQRGDRMTAQPAPSILMLLTHCCCRDRGKVPASVNHLRTHLRAYGIDVSGQELRNGATSRDLERLGLVVDSPDAGGGRLLVDPFYRRDRS